MLVARTFDRRSKPQRNMTAGHALESCYYVHRNAAQQLGVPDPNLRQFIKLYNSLTEIVVMYA